MNKARSNYGRQNEEYLESRLQKHPRASAELSPELKDDYMFVLWYIYTNLFLDS